MRSRSRRIRSTRMTAALLRFSKKLHKKLEKSLASDLKVTFEVEDAEDTDGNPSGSTALMIDIEKDGGWGGSNNVFINGYVGVSGKQRKIKDEAYLDGVQVGDWDKGSSTIGLSGCGIGEFLVLMFSLFAIKANNTLVLLHNAGGDRAQNVYEKVGFYLTRSKEADDEMIVDLAGKKKGQTAGAEWKKRYDVFRKKVGTRLKKCKEFWRDLPPTIAEPSPVSMPGARGTRKRRRRRKKGGNGTKRKRTGSEKDNDRGTIRYEPHRRQARPPPGYEWVADPMGNLRLQLTEAAYLQRHPEGQQGGRKTRKRRGGKRR